MGARNNSGAFLMWGHLPDGAFRMLVGMAHTALDDDGRDIRTGEVIPARRWFGSEDTLVTYVRSHDDKGKVRSHAAKRAAAYRFLAQLVEAGAVKCVRVATGGARSWYALNLDPLAIEEFNELEHRTLNRAPKMPARRKESLTQSDTAVSEPVRHSVSEPVRHSVSEPVRHTPYASHEEVPQELPPRTTTPQVSTSPAVGVHVLVDGKTWADVPLLTVGTDGYDEAKSFLDRTIGTAAAATAVAGYMASGCPSYVDAVVTAAWNSGWEPEPPP